MQDLNTLLLELSNIHQQTADRLKLLAQAKEPAATVSVAEPETPAVSREDLREVLVKLTTTQGREAGIALLEQFGAKTLSEIPESDYGKVLAIAIKALT